MRSIAIIFCFALVLFSFSQTQATIIHVPGDQPSIQAGIDASSNGDTVLVAPGTYYEHINFNGRAILVTSEAGAQTTFIEKLQNDVSIVIFATGEDTTSVLDGFTIRNADGGSGIECQSASPLIENNIVTYNISSGFGGGILCVTSHPTIRNNRISSNTAAWGGGIRIHTSSPTIVNNEIVSNTATMLGGGIHCTDLSHATITGNTIISNTCDAAGGGILVDNTSGGVVSFNLVCDNVANGRGGGIFCHNNSTPLVLNNTVARNSGYAAQAGGIVCQLGCSPTLINNIVSDNIAGYGIHCSENSFPSISYDDVWNNAEGNYYECTPGEGCISADPLFCNPPAGDYHLRPSSPCAGTGQGGSDMGAFGVKCGVNVTPGPDQSDTATTDDVSVKFYIENLQLLADAFDVNVTDSLGWSIDPLYYEVALDSSQLDSVSFTVSIPNVPIGTTDRISATAISQTDSTVRASASLTVTCSAFFEGVELTVGSDQSGYADSIVSVAFLVQNVGVVPDSYSLDISDTQGWNIVPLHYDLVLDTAQIDSASFTISIPYVPLGTTDQLTLLAVSKTNPLARDSASLTVTCSAYVEGWDITSGEDINAQANSQVSAVFHVQNTGLAPDSCNVTIEDSLGWNIQPTDYLLNLDPGQQDTLLFDVQIPNTPVGTTNKLILAGGSLTNPFVVDSASLLITCTSRIIHVPADFAAIQLAINFSSDGDSILVSPDTYYEHLNFTGKAIVLKSENGPDSTIISKLAGGVSMVSFISGEDSNSVLDGFTITGANLESGQGAGIKCLTSSPKILNNKIVNNSCPYGAGIDCDNYSSPIIANNVIEQNPATSEGGGIRCSNHSSPVIRENIIVGNSAAESGAGIWCVDHCLPTINGNLIAGNTAQTGYAGAIGLLTSSTADITGNTVDRNSASAGGGIYIDNTSSATIVNTIVTNTPSGKGIRFDGSPPLIIYYCDVWNNLDENYYGCLPGEGCISTDPIFCDPDNGNYYLWITSPCLGTGQDGANIGAFGEGCSLVGDANGDGVIDLGDVIYLINYLYKDGPAPDPLEAGDCNCDGVVNLGDVVYLINYLFKGGPPPGC